MQNSLAGSILAALVSLALLPGAAGAGTAVPQPRPEILPVSAPSFPVAGRLPLSPGLGGFRAERHGDAPMVRLFRDTWWGMLTGLLVGGIMVALNSDNSREKLSTSAAVGALFVTTFSSSGSSG